MRNLNKLEEPNVLFENKDIWLKEYLDDIGNTYRKYKYRDSDIKEQLKKETGFKCVYCESKIGHNTPGDTEHIVPSSKQRELHFTWENLTIACAECNRRKNNYYEEGDEFLNPYLDDVESLLEHHGPYVSWVTNNVRAEITVKTLELNSETRVMLFIRKSSVLDDFTNLVERYATEENQILKGLHRKNIEEKMQKSSEYSAMLISFLDKKGITII
jgi:uncharacterized protein (TIGR02646 family)